MIRECFMMISKRSDRVCNFLEDVGAWSKDTKLVYRVYATLYFIFVVDGSESELGILDLIHVFVESLDHVFENVCELDLIFHTDKVSFAMVVTSFQQKSSFFYAGASYLGRNRHGRHGS
jgi:AP-3 complex subunit sigma